jgi:hypothetical protein
LSNRPNSEVSSSSGHFLKEEELSDTNDTQRPHSTDATQDNIDQMVDVVQECSLPNSKCNDDYSCTECGVSKPSSNDSSDDLSSLASTDFQDGKSKDKISDALLAVDSLVQITSCPPT